MSVCERRSLLSFICPRVPSFGLIDGFRLSHINRNLLVDFNSCEIDVTHNQPMKVYLRIRPFEISNDKSVIHYVNKHTVTVYPPNDDNKYSHTSVKGSSKFIFSHVFDEFTRQNVIFECVASEQIRLFLEGLNSLIFAYGTTSSGKTFTLQGTITDFGIIPRAFHSMFNIVKHRADPSFMPKDFSDVVRLSVPEIEKLIKDKDSILKLFPYLIEGVGFKTGSDNECVESKNEVLSRSSFCLNETISELQSIGDLCFTFWISFVEIYNEVFYDLLDPALCTFSVTGSFGNLTGRLGCNQQQSRNIFSVGTNVNGFGNGFKRTSLDLRTDKNGNVYIKGVRWFPVYSAQEALELISIGRQCQKVAATRLNQASSRSHSILGVRAIRVVNKENPCFARSSTLMFCDLAGSERSEKAGTGGHSLRIREAGNINASLLTLGRCIEYLRFNQMHPDNPKMVPYRDSKLTRLFKGFFTGHGKASMIVNASPNPELFEETVHALRFSALAKQIIVKPNVMGEAQIFQSDELTRKQQEQERVEKEKEKKKEKEKEKEKENKKKSNFETKPVIETPPTVVKKTVHNTNSICVVASDFDDSSILNDFELGESTLQSSSAAAAATTTTNTSVLDNSASQLEFGTPKTPINNDDGELILDHYSKEELIAMVRELSESLFECKGELIEQEERLKREMCENMNQQFIELEKNYEEALKRRNQLLDREFDERKQYYVDLVTKRRARQSDMSAKRPCPDDSSYTIDDDEDDDGDRDNNNNMGRDHQSGMEHNVCYRCEEQAQLLQLRMDLYKQAEDRITELEEDFADQRDVIESLMQDRDHHRMEVTRLEFSLTAQQMQIGDKRSAHGDATKLIPMATQTEDSIAKSTQNPVERFHSSVESDTKLSSKQFLLTEGTKFFESFTDSPDQQLRLAKMATSQTPSTVVKCPIKVSKCSLDDSREPLFNGEKTMTQDSECTPMSAHDLDHVRESRISEGLQSFLAHETQSNHEEEVESLRKQIYDLEKRFAQKHDALAQSELTYQDLKIDYDELSRRLIRQAEDMCHLNAQIDKLNQLHLVELERVKDEIQNECEARFSRNDKRPTVEVETQIATNSVHQALQTSLIGTNQCDLAIQVSPSPFNSAVQTQTAMPHNSLSICRSSIHSIEPQQCTTLISIGTLTDAQPTTDTKPENLPKAKAPNRFRSKLANRRMTERFGPPPQIPLALQSAIHFSDSDEHHDDDRDNDGEKENWSSPPLVSKPLINAGGRKAKSSSTINNDLDNDKPRKPKTRSAAASRKLVSLSAQQHLPDSFFQDELDAVLEESQEQVRKDDERRNLRKMNLRPAPRKRR